MSARDMEFGLSSREASSSREAPNKHEKGSKKYKEMIARDASNSSLPFSFSKPQKAEALTTVCSCPDCGTFSRGSKNLYMVICSKCSSIYKVSRG